MAIADDDRTSSALLARLRDWSDADAWLEGLRLYRPMIERWAALHGLDAEAVDEVTQRVLTKLAIQMRAFTYDPTASFRGWLRAMVRTVTLDYAKERQRAGRRVDPDDRLDGLAWPAHDGGDPWLPLLERARAIQESVRGRFGGPQWDVWWRVDILGEPTVDAARAAGLGIRAAYQAIYRIRKRLAEEGRRAGRPRADDPGDEDHDALPR